MCISKDFLLILAMSTTKSPCQEICEIPSMLCFWKEQLTVTNVLGVLFWSLFPLLWVDRLDFALESPTAMVDLAVALVVLKHCEAQGWLQCTSCRHRGGFLPQGACHGMVCEVRWGFKGKEEWYWIQKPPFTSWPIKASGPLLLEVGWRVFWLMRLQSKTCQKVHL